MNRPVFFAALIGIAVVTIGFVQIPAVAQPNTEAVAWEVTVSPFGQSSYVVVKHNRVTGQTLVLDCSKGCSTKSKWWDLPKTAIK